MQRCPLASGPLWTTGQALGGRRTDAHAAANVKNIASALAVRAGLLSKDADIPSMPTASADCTGPVDAGQVLHSRVTISPFTQTVSSTVPSLRRRIAVPCLSPFT